MTTFFLYETHKLEKDPYKTKFNPVSKHNGLLLNNYLLLLLVTQYCYCVKRPCATIVFFSSSLVNRPRAKVVLATDIPPADSPL